MMRYDGSKVIPYKKRLALPKLKLKSLFKHNGNYVTIVSLYGFLKKDDVALIKSIIERDLQKGIQSFIVNFSNVSHINYKDVHILLSIKEKIAKCRGEIKFVVKKPYIIALLFVGGWPFIYNFYPSFRSAINAFRKEYFLNWRENVHNTYSGSIKGND